MPYFRSAFILYTCPWPIIIDQTLLSKFAGDQSVNKFLMTKFSLILSFSVSPLLASASGGRPPPVPSYRRIYPPVSTHVPPSSSVVGQQHIPPRRVPYPSGYAPLFQHFKLSVPESSSVSLSSPFSTLEEILLDVDDKADYMRNLGSKDFLWLL